MECRRVAALLLVCSALCSEVTGADGKGRISYLATTSVVQFSVHVYTYS